MEPEFPLVLNIALVVLIFVTTFFREYSILNQNYESDFKIRSHRKVFGIYELFYAIAWTLLFWFNNYESNMIFMILILWSIPFSEFIMWFIYKQKKPFTLFVKNNEIILNERWTQKRNLSELTQIQYDRFSKNLKLYFKSKSKISIKTKEYNTDDIKKLLEILIEKSENNISIPNNYKPKIKNSC